MRIKKIYYYLRSLSQSEWIGFSKQIMENHADLSELLASAYKNRKYLEKKLSKELKIQLFENLADGPNFSENLNRLENELEHFLETVFLKKDPLKIKDQIAISKLYQRRGLSKLLLDELGKKRQELTDKIPSAEDHYRLYELTYHTFFYNETLKANEKTINYLKDAQEQLHQFYLCQQLKIAVEFLFHTGIYSVTTDQNIRYSTTHLLEDARRYPDHHLIQFYALFLRYLDDRKKEQSSIHEKYKLDFFFKIQYLFFLIAPNLSEREQTDAAVFINNFAAQKIARGENEYRIPFWGFMKKAFEKGYMVTNNSISDESYLGAVDLAASLGFNEDVKNFQESFQNKLLPQRKKIVLTLAQATIFFHQGNYEDCIQILTQYDTGYMDSGFKLRIRLLLLRSYFMWALNSKYKLLFTQEARRFYNYCDYTLKRKDIVETRKRFLDNLREALLKIFRAYNESTDGLTPEQAKDLIQYINDTPMYGGPWAKTQIRKLTKGASPDAQEKQSP